MLVRLKDDTTIGMVMDFMCANDLSYEVVKEDNKKSDDNEYKDDYNGKYGY